MKNLLILPVLFLCLVDVSAQNVGIGTLTPNHALEIHANSVLGGKAQLLLFEDENDFARLKFQNNSFSSYWILRVLIQKRLRKQE
jgi:hypothetical protein